MSVSVTTRSKRANEVEGKDYFFVSRNVSRNGARRRLSRTCHVFGNRYGTPAAAVEKVLATGRDVLFDIDWQALNSWRKRPGMTWFGCLSCRPRAAN